MPEAELAARSAIFVDEGALVVAEEEALGVLVDIPAIDLVDEDGAVAAMAECLGDVRTVVDDDAFVEVALESPLILGREEFVGGGGEIAGVVVGCGDDVGAFA